MLGAFLSAALFGGQPTFDAVVAGFGGEGTEHELLHFEIFAGGYALTGSCAAFVVRERHFRLRARQFVDDAHASRNLVRASRFAPQHRHAIPANTARWNDREEATNCIALKPFGVRVAMESVVTAKAVRQGASMQLRCHGPARHLPKYSLSATTCDLCIARRVRSPFFCRKA